jgi:hypothetical protein
MILFSKNIHNFLFKFNLKAVVNCCLIYYWINMDQDRDANKLKVPRYNRGTQAGKSKIQQPSKV